MKKIIFSVLIFTAVLGGFFYFRYQVYYSHGNFSGEKTFEIVKGDGNTVIAEKLQQGGLISNKNYFYYYVRMHGFLNKFLPGKYSISGNMTIPEIVVVLTDREKAMPEFSKITFPEGWDLKKMSERLTVNGFDGAGFLEIAEKPSVELKNKYLYPEDKSISSLEGYLFPDTYFLKPGTSAENIIKKMLDNFNSKITEQMKADIKSQNKTLKQIIIMASIIEREVKTDEDRAVVSGIFWTRIKIGQALESCATLSYCLGVNKKQYTYADTRTNSPYNTYLNPGLPPGPISNPGLSAIKAAIYPEDSQYNFFLSDPDTEQTIFSKTLDEHNANKLKYGL